MKRHLYDCTTAVERLEWVKSRLHGGHTVTEHSLGLAGVPSPRALIAGLRAMSMEIETMAVELVDARGDLHKGCTAWRLMPSLIGSEATRSARQGANATIKHPTVPEHEKAA